MNRIPKIVFSRRPMEMPWSTTTTEYHLLIKPVAHGGGSPLFTQFTKLNLVDVKSSPRGDLALTYTRPDQPAA